MEVTSLVSGHGPKDLGRKAFGYSPVVQSMCADTHTHRWEGDSKRERGRRGKKSVWEKSIWEFFVLTL